MGGRNLFLRLSSLSLPHYRLLLAPHHQCTIIGLFNFFFLNYKLHHLILTQYALVSTLLCLRFPLFYFIFIDVRISRGSVCQWVLCTVHGTHHLFDNPNFHWNDIVQWVLCTVHETHKFLYSVTFSLKIGLTTLLTHLKIILLEYFQFLAK